MSFHIYTSSGSSRYDFPYADSLSTNLFSVEADRNDRFADGAFNFDDALYCLRIRVKQPFIFTTWTSHMHFLHIFSPPARGQPKGNVKLTVGDCFIFLCTVCRDLNPMAAINIVYRTCVLLSIIFALPRKSWRSFIRLNLRQNLYLQISGSKTVKYNYSAQSIHQNTLNCSIINFYSVILKSKFIITDFNSVFTVVKSLSLC